MLDTEDFLASSQPQRLSQQPQQQQQQQQPSKPKRTRMTAEEKEAAAARKQAEAAAKKHARQYNSALHVLRFLTVVLDPELMTSPLGLHIVQAFQATRQKTENEHIQYKVAPAGLDGLPAIKWLRKVPSSLSTQASTDLQGLPGGSQVECVANEGPDASLVETEEPQVMLCFEADDFVRRIQHDELRSVFTLLSQRCPEHRPHILVHRLKAYLVKKEREDHKRTMGGG